MAKKLPRWSQILQQIPQHEINLLPKQMNIDVVTLQRWLNGQFRPQPEHAIDLIKYVPHQYRAELIDALTEIHAELRNSLFQKAPFVSLKLISHVLGLRTTTTDTQLFWQLTDEILKDALELLDPYSLGLSITLVQCMPPRGKYVESLRESYGKGHSPWPPSLEHDVIFLGLESLSGEAVEKCAPSSCADLLVRGRFAVQDDYDRSAISWPIRFDGKVAGCLLASSMFPQFFTTEHNKALEMYANLIALAFPPDAFYTEDQIRLRMLPHPKDQRDVVRTFHERLLAHHQKARRQGRGMPSNLEINQIVWHEIEGILIQKADEDLSKN